MEAVIVQSEMAQRIEIYEQGSAGTADYRVASPSTSDPSVLRPAGSRIAFVANPDYDGWFLKGQVVGYVETVSGVITFAQEET